MTPQEKAKELLSKLFPYTYGWVNRKKIAIIMVNKIIESRKDDSAFDDTLSSTSSEYYAPHPMYLTYWLQVRQEIEKL